MKRTALLLTAILWVTPALAAFTIPPNDGFVTDTVGIMDATQEEALERTLKEYRDETSNEIAILIVDSLDGEVISDVAVEVGRSWGIGTKESNNGILILMSYGDRDIWMATGYGLEGAVPDIVAKGIVEEDMLPQFRDGNFFQGFADGIDSLKKHIGGEYTAERYTESDGIGLPWQILIFAGFILLNLSAAVLGRTKSWWLGGVLGAILGVVFLVLAGWWLAIPLLTAIGLLFDYIASKTYKPGRRGGWRNGGGWGGSGGSSGSSSGSSFGGFSGGSFGGGGAGGSW